jgi:basic membrane lipoprotein Med (substrate-binding protein (PBP1-ABC) superfamily)
MILWRKVGRLIFRVQEKKGTEMSYSKLSRTGMGVGLLATGILAIMLSSGPSAAGDGKIAGVFSGPITDKGFTEHNYEALKEQAEREGFEFVYTDSVAPSSMVEALRGYARSGSKLVVGLGEEFTPPATQVGAEFPDVNFVVINSNKANEKNVAGVLIDAWPLGYVSGVIAAHQSATKTVGFINGMEFASTKRAADGFIAGAKSVDPAVNVLSVFTGDFADPAKGRAAATAMISGGADVLVSALDLGAQGIVAAAKQAGNVHMIGFFVDQAAELKKPELFYTSAIENWPETVREMVRLVKSGKFEGKNYNFAIENPKFAYLAPFGPAVSQETKDAVEAVIADFRSGKLRAP